MCILKTIYIKLDKLCQCLTKDLIFLTYVFNKKSFKQ